MNLGQFIKQKRLEKHLTLEQLGEIIGKPKNFVCRIENGKVNSLKDNTIKLIAEALDVPIIDFFTGYDENGNSIKKPDEIEEISKSEFKNEVLNMLDKIHFENNNEKDYFIYSLNRLCEEDDKK